MIGVDFASLHSMKNDGANDFGIAATEPLHYAEVTGNDHHRSCSALAVSALETLVQHAGFPRLVLPEKSGNCVRNSSKEREKKGRPNERVGGSLEFYSLLLLLLLSHTK